MDYLQAMAFLEDTKKYGSQLGLTSIQNLMKELGNVQEEIPVVHIAGTNGKGSVGAMLSSVLVEAGYQVGRFNTPDVFAYEEEFLMNGEPIEKDRLAQLFTKVAVACETLVERGLPHPTRFEVETAAAFLWFYEEKCDLALVEVGMGGETDATNLIQRPVVSVLTSISMDHMKFLGNTLAEIASVKAGIIKERCPVVCMAQHKEAEIVIRNRCEALRAPLTMALPEMAQNVVCDANGVSFDWIWENGIFGSDEEQPVEHMELGLLGSYQVENAVCVLKVLKLLKRYYPQITLDAVKTGLYHTRWPGRFERIQTHPTVILDGAHNEDAVLKLRASLDQNFPGKRIVFIMGVLADKEYEKMIRIMFREQDKVFTLTPPNPRALSAQDLAELLKQQNVDAIYCENPRDAVSYALEEAGAEDVILAFGSLYYLNGIRRAFLDK